MATSINGMITIGQDDSDWVSKVDWSEFDKLMRSCGIMIMGKRTYEIFGDDFPREGATNVVMTSDKKLLKQKTPNNVIFTNKSPKDVVQMAEKRGFKKLMLIGGMTLNTSFIKENLVDEIWLSVHPLIIGQGKSLIKSLAINKKLKTIGVKRLEEGLVQLRYEIIK